MPRVELQAEMLVNTAELMAQRIGDRFEGRGIARISTDVRHAAGEAKELAARIQKPNRYLRLGSFLVVCLIIGVVVKLAYHLKFTAASGWDMLEGIDAGASTSVYLGLVVLFLLNLDTRIKRRKALDAIKELRALAHVIDMHQLGKDPDSIPGESRPGESVSGLGGTPTNRPSHPDSAPTVKRLPMNQDVLARYLDDCSDLLAIIGKIAALYAQETQDAVVLAAVDEIEHLTTALSSKIWQKIVILDRKLGAV